MNDDQRDNLLPGDIKDRLDAGLDRLDPAIAARLRQSRRQAVSLAERRLFLGLRMPRLAPVAGFASAVAVVVALSLWYGGRPRLEAKGAEEIEVLTAQAPLEMYKDLELFRWLAESHETR